MIVWMKARNFGSGQTGLDQTSLTIITVLISISLYTVIELFCLIFATFKRYAGLYFWCFIVATLGIALACIGFLIKYWGPSSLGYLSCTLSLMGWVCMVTGQSMVLWSRLHLIMHDQKRLMMILWIIIINAIVLHGITIPLVYGSFSSHAELFKRPYAVTEKIQVTVFFLQEVSISSFYIVETVSLLKLERSVLGNVKASRRLMRHLIILNIVIILLDITILVLEFCNLYDFQISYKPFAYSVKLRLEFTVLNRLVEVANSKKEASFSLQSEKSHATTSTVIAMETFISGDGKKITSGPSYHAYARGGRSDGECSNSRVASYPDWNESAVVTGWPTIQSIQRHQPR